MYFLVFSFWSATYLLFFVNRSQVKATATCTVYNVTEARCEWKPKKRRYECGTKTSDLTCTVYGNQCGDSVPGIYTYKSKCVYFNNRTSCDYEYTTTNEGACHCQIECPTDTPAPTSTTPPETSPSPTPTTVLPTPTPTPTPGGGGGGGDCPSYTYGNYSWHPEIWCTSGSNCDNIAVECKDCQDFFCGGNSTCRRGKQDGTGYCSVEGDVKCLTCKKPDIAFPTPTPHPGLLPPPKARQCVNSPGNWKSRASFAKPPCGG